MGIFSKKSKAVASISRSGSRIVIIAGSSAKDAGNNEMVTSLARASGWDVVDLNDYEFSYFDYDHKNKGDDFLPLMRRLIADYDTLVFATPVYWYAMSGIMKVFFDRITDLITIEKDLGRQLRGKRMAAISCSYGGNLGEHFWLPFQETAKYLGMTYTSSLHTITDEDATEAIQQFVDEVNALSL